jgi:hypothetical protein
MRTFTDENLLVWEVYASGGRHGFSDNAHLAFHCLSDPSMRPRTLTQGGDNAEAARLIGHAEPERLLALLHQAEPIG